MQNKSDSVIFIIYFYVLLSTMHHKYEVFSALLTSGNMKYDMFNP